MADGVARPRGGATRRSVLRSAGAAAAVLAAPTLLTASGTDSPTPTGPRFGANYVPSRNWWYSWLDWNPEAIREDLHAIAGLGLDHIRIHCLWSIFQPDPHHVSTAALDRLEELVTLADNADLDVCVTVVNGWLSGMYFRPSWQHERMNMFSDPVAIQAQLDLISFIADRVADHPRVLGLDIGNEPNVLVRYVGNTSTTTADGDAWVRRLLRHCEQVAPRKMHVAGFDHQPWITDAAPFSRDVLASTGAATALHAWVGFTGALSRYGPQGTGTYHLAEYMIELAKAHHREPGRQVWLQEFGIAPQWIQGADPADFADRSLSAALGCGHLWGVTWWASHDIDRDLRAFQEVEYDLGLLTIQNKIKPTGQRIAEFVRRVRASPVEVHANRVSVALPEGRTPDLEFADQFFQLVDSGEHPRITLTSNADAH